MIYPSVDYSEYTLFLDNDILVNKILNMQRKGIFFLISHVLKMYVIIHMPI